jgi:hypothetical protein
MDEEKVITLEILADWFKANPAIQYTMPWGLNFLSHFMSLGKGCKCNHKKKLANVEVVYRDAVSNIVGKNENFISIFKREFKARKLIFKVKEEDEEVLLEV